MPGRISRAERVGRACRRPEERRAKHRALVDLCTAQTTQILEMLRWIEDMGLEDAMPRELLARAQEMSK